jgi:hypothetical protein
MDKNAVVQVTLGWWSAVGPILGVIVGWFLTSWTTRKQNDRDDRKWRRERRDTAIMECLRLCFDFRSRVDAISLAAADHISNYNQWAGILLSLEPWLALLVRHAEEEEHEDIRKLERV